MCGIAGQFRWGDGPASPLMLKKMLIDNQARGTDAAGVAWWENERIRYIKDSGPAAKLANITMSERQWEVVARSPIVLMHARAATQGTEKVNANNHPVIAGNWLVTHNGHIRNDKDLLTYYGLADERPAEVDTVAINLALAHGESVEDSLAHVSTVEGAATFAAWNSAEPENLLLVRLNTGAPLYLHVTSDRVLWSSDVDGIRKTSRVALAGLEVINASVLPINQALLLTPRGVKRFRLTPAPFKMPHATVYPINQYQRKGETPTGQSRPLASGNNTTQTAGGGLSPQVQKALERPTLVVTNPRVIPVGTKNRRTTTDIESGAQFTKEVREAQTTWFEKPQAPGASRVITFPKKGVEVSCLFDYPALGKPGPRFEPGLVAMACDPPAKGKFTTPYGRWLVTRHNSFFKGAKRVKQFWKDTIDVAIDREVSLPAGDQLATLLEDFYKLEPVRVFTTNDEWTALMCPWCGILSRGLVWSEWGHKCKWCGIKSSSPMGGR